MDGVWNFRNAYNQAKIIKEKQDAFCEKVEKNDWEGLLDVAEDSVEIGKKKGKNKISEEDLEFPEELQWEALVDVLRGRVKVCRFRQNIQIAPLNQILALSTLLRGYRPRWYGSGLYFSFRLYSDKSNCYLLSFAIQLTNEFKFPIASFHHAGETYLVPSLLKRVYPGKPPAIALFASNFRKKREAYRGSEFAPAILAEEGIPVVMKVCPIFSIKDGIDYMMDLSRITLSSTVDTCSLKHNKHITMAFPRILLWHR